MKPRRLEKLKSFLKERVAKIILLELKDPRIGFVTVLDVDVTKDGRYADISVSILGEDVQKRKAMRALEDSAGFISCEVAKDLDIRTTPKCRFHLDETVEKQIRLEKLIENAIADTRRNEEMRQENQNPEP